MGLFERLMNMKPERRVTLYHSPSCLDCQAAKQFFARNGIEVELYDVVQDAQAREEMEKKFGRVGTPAIVIGNQVFWGFEDNKEDIAELLGADPGSSNGDEPSFADDGQS
ncbi:MAG: hypothetical protein Kow00129_16870 [Thermoleophilia bacterium]